LAAGVLLLLLELLELDSDLVLDEEEVDEDEEVDSLDLLAGLFSELAAAAGVVLPARLSVR
jgi:hypothetical protein